MSTFLELTQVLRQEVDLPGTGPATVLNQTGDLANLVEWTKQAWVELQVGNGGLWRWLRHGFSVNTVAGTDTYAFGGVTDTNTSAVIDRFNRWHLSDRNAPPMSYLTASGVAAQTWLTFISYDYFRNIYKIGTAQQGAPAHITIDPADRLLLGPVPNDIYTIVGEFYRGPQVMAADATVPEMPVQYHKLIVYRAMIDYGYHQVAQEVLNRAERRAKGLFRGLHSTQMAPFDLARPIA